MFKKVIVLLLACALAVGMMVACNGDEGSITFDGPDEWARSQLQAIPGGYDELAARVEAETGMAVNITSAPWGAWMTRLPVIVAGGDPPDVFMINGPDVPAFMHGGHTMDLSVLGDEFLSQFYPAALAQFNMDGVIAALPFTTDCRILWYNRDLFEAVGLDPDTPPTTWDELLEFALMFEGAVVDGQRVFGFGMDLGLREPPARSLLTASEFQLFDPETMEPTVDNDTFRSFLQLLVDMSPAYQSDFTTEDHHDVGILFGQGRIAMVIAGTWIWALNEGIDDEPWVGTAPVPRMCEDSPHGSFGGGWAIAVSSRTENPEAALVLARTMFDHDLSHLLHTDVTPMFGADAYSDLFTNPSPHAETFRQQMPHARRLSPALTIYEAEFELILWEEISNVLIGQTTIDDAVVNITDRMNAAMGR